LRRHPEPLWAGRSWRAQRKYLTAAAMSSLDNNHQEQSYVFETI
jgi:hypothetical protein